MVDPDSLQALYAWHRDPWALRALFSDSEIQRLEAARRGVVRSRRTVVYCTWENPFARGGGIIAVAENLPQALRSVARDVVVLSPFHARLKTVPDTAPPEIAATTVSFGDRTIQVRIRQVEHRGVRWVLVDADDFFDAPGGPHGDNPYDYSSEEDPDVDSDACLRRDSLFVCAAIPSVLAALGIAGDVVLHAQDWQFAAGALTIKEAVLADRLQTAAAVLTLHNPYDCPLDEDDLERITRRTQRDRWPRLGSPARPGRRTTFYERMIPLFDAPVSTVSRSFARELVSHPLQTVHFASHLQDVFHRQGLVGVDNGLFMKPRRAFSVAAARRALEGDGAMILAEKQTRRRAMLDILSHYRPPRAWGRLRGADGDDLTTLPDRIPVFMMFGRLDPGQKGFDLLARAIERIEPGAMRFVLAPIVPARVSRFADDLARMAASRPGDVVVFPFRMTEGYWETMAGATYCVMPSLHEPFGAATEPYLMGTPVVAHATGGLVQQVCDFDADPKGATGVLFRSSFRADDEELGRQWKAILESPDPGQRMRSPLYASLVHALIGALERAAEIHRNHSAEYGRMLANLYDQATRFSWEIAADGYGHLYDVACNARGGDRAGLPNAH